MAAGEWLFSLTDIAEKLPEEPGVDRLHYMLRHGTMKIGFYAPKGSDRQAPHKQDELYVVAGGRGAFVKNGERRPFGPQDVIFVQAGADHHFEDLSDDFAVWVIFWGPEGGED